MRHSLPCVFVAAATLTLLVPATSSAQTIPSPYEFIEPRQELGPAVGFMSVNTGRFGYAPSGGLILGARYAIELSGPLAFEGALTMVDATRDVVDPARVEGDRVIGEADASVALIEAGLRFTVTGRRSWHSLAPFLLLRGGIAIDASSSSELDDVLLPEDVYEFGTSFFGALGVGSRYFLSESLGLRGDAIFSLWKVDTPPGFADPSRGFGLVSDSEWLAGSTVGLALFYRW